MANNDTPIQNNVPVVEDTPITIPKTSPESVKLRDMFTLQEAYINSYRTGVDVTETYRPHSSAEEARAALKAASVSKAKEDRADILQEYVNDPNLGGQPAEVNLQATTKAAAQALVTGSDTDRQFVEAVTTLDGIHAVEEATAKTKLRRLLAEAEAEVGGLDVAKGIGMAITPFWSTIDQYSLTGEFFGGKELMERALVNFKTKPYTEQLELWPAIKTELIDKLGKWEGTNVLRKFLEPGGENDLSEFSDWWKLLDAADAVGIAQVARIGAKTASVPSIMRSVGNTEEAVRVTVEGVANKEIADLAGVAPDTPINTAMPFDTSTVDLEATGELSNASIKSLEETFKTIDDTAADIIANKGLLREGILNSEERLAAEEATKTKFMSAGHENIRAVSRDEASTTFAYQTRDIDGNLIDEEFTLDLELSDVGSWGQRKASIVAEMLGSNTWLAKGRARKDVNTAQRLEYLNAKVNNQLNEAMLTAIKPIGSPFKLGTKDKLAKVNHALLEGDNFKHKSTGDRGKVWSPDELRSQFDLEEPEILAYYNINRLYNNLFLVSNDVARKEHVVRGLKDITLGENIKAFGKPYDTAESASKVIKDNDAQYIFDPDLGISISAKDTDSLLKAYEDGRMLVKLNEPVSTGEDIGDVLYAFARTEDVSQLPRIVLHKKEGYVPRVYENSAYFVKEVTKRTVDGKTTYPKRAVRFFNNKKDAETYKETLIQKAIDEEGLAPSEAIAKYVTVPDRESETFATAVGQFGEGQGGIYTSARAEDALLYGLNGDEAVRVNAFEALTRNIATVAKATSINEWRLGLEQRWINSVNDHLVSIGEVGNVSKFGGLPDTIKSSDAGAFFAKMERTIRDWQGFPSREEQLWAGAVQNTVDWAAGKGLAKTSEKIGSLKAKDPIAAARGAAFHSLLGWFNPAQLWVQAQGTSVAMSLAAGKYATKAVRNTTALTALGEGTVEQGARFKMASKVAAVDADELKAMHEAWLKTGLGDSVLQTADHAAAAKGYGITQAALKTAADKGLLFYRAGELTSRRTAFSVAVERYKEANKLDSIKGISDDAIKEIFDDTNNMLLNMTKANRAEWQKGIFSLPTQFLQVTTKTLETVTGANRNFTRQEIGRILAGQLALYGSAGIPLVGLPVMWATQSLGFTQEDLDNNPGLVKAVNDGFWGGMSHWVLGTDIELSSRGSLLRGATEFVDRWLLSEATMQERMLGAFGTTGQRVWDSFAEQIAPISLGVHEVSHIDVVKIPTLSVLNAFSSFRNGEKAYIMEAIDRINNKHGRAIVDKDFKLNDIVAAAIGFRLSDEDRGYDIKERNDHHRNVKRKIVDIIVKMQNDYALRANKGRLTDEYQENYDAEMSLLMKIMPNPMDNVDIMNMVEKAFLEESRLDSERNRYKENIAVSTAEGVSALKAAMLGYKTLTIDTDTEEKE